MKNSSLLALLLFLFGFLFANETSGINETTDSNYSDNSKTIQFNVKSLLNARVVTTISNGKLITWNKGVDGSWSGLATRSAADSMGSKDKVAFPNDGVFAANRFHPMVMMNFSNSDSVGNQVRFTDKNVTDIYSFQVVENYYSNISLFFMSAFGTSNFSIEITYSDNTTEKKDCTVEDWATNLSETETKYFLSANLAKWGDKNTELEKDNHYLIGINISPSINKRVVKITVYKPASETTLTFWGGTGYGAPSKSWTVSGNSPYISYEGRTIVTEDGAVRLGYPGIVVRVNFTGTALSMHTQTTSNELYLDVSIDGSTPVFLKIPKGESDVVLAKELNANEHKIEIFKRIESCVGILDILSLTVTGNLISPPPLPLRRLMFLGDSFTAGQATTVEDGGSMDPNKAMRQNARLSYGRLLADRLQAQSHIIAYAGRGVVRDWQGISSVRCAPEYYEYALPDDTTTQWNPQTYIPDAIGVCLGNNDFGVGIPDQTEYIAAYIKFLRKLRRDAPNAYIFLITSPSLTDEPGRIPYRSVQKAYLDEITKQFGDPRLQVIQISEYAVVPNDWHPSGTSHRAIVNELEPFFRKALNW